MSEKAPAAAPGAEGDRRYFRIVAGLSVVPLAFAVVSLFGWMFDVPALRHLWVSPVAMNPVTCLCFILMGLKSLRRLLYPDSQLLDKISTAATAFVLFVGFAKLADMMMGTPLFDVDGKLFPAQLQTEAGFPNRMAPNTALCLALLGLAFLFRRFRSDALNILSQAFASLVLLVSTAALLGYFYDLRAFYVVANATPMAAPTALSAMAVAGVILLDAAREQRVGKRVMTFAVVTVFMLLGSLQTTLILNQQAEVKNARQLVEHTYLVKQNISDMERAVDEAKEGELGYLLTGRKGCLELYEESSGQTIEKKFRASGGNETINQLFTSLRDLTKDNPEQQAALVTLGALLGNELKFLDRQITGKESGEALPQLVKSEEATDAAKTLARVDEILAKMMQRENTLLTARLQDFRNTDTAFVRYMSSAAAVTYGTLLLAIVLTIVSANRARYSRDKISDFIKHMPAAVAVCDRDMRYLMVSDRWYSDFRLKQPNIIGKSHYDVFYAMPAGWRAILSRCMETGESSSDEEKFELKGKPFWLHWDVRPWRESDGRIGGIIMATEIVTERKEAEQALKNAKAAADAASRAKSEFLASMNHELRTPLTSIRGALGLIDGGALGAVPPRVADMVKRAYSNSERLSRLINDILDLEKIEAGKMQIDIRLVGVEPLLRQSLEANQMYAAKFGVRYALQSSAPGVEVMADPDRLMQVLANLLSNAAKFSPEGGTVEVRAYLRKGRVRYEIEDHGAGIPEEFRGRIFEKFSQADGADNRRREGTGLGLSIARNLVEEMGGSIGFETEEGKGTMFFFDLPGYRAEAAKPAAGEKPAQGKILICEDERGTAEYIRFLLGRVGYEADVARTVDEAREKIRAGRYDAVTLDLALGAGNGADLLRDLRGDPATRDLPVVVVSGKADEAKRTLSGGALNVADWLLKPFDPDRIVQAVRGAARERGVKMPVIMHVEDDRDLSLFIQEALRDKAEVIPAYTVREAKEQLKRRVYDLVILDIGMPDASGLELLEALPQIAAAPPVLILSASETAAEVQKRVAAALVKSRISEGKVVETIISLINPPPKNSQTA